MNKRVRMYVMMSTICIMYACYKNIYTVYMQTFNEMFE